MKISSVAIVGLGLIGGSFAKAIKEKLPGVTVRAVETNEEYLDAAKAEGVISYGAAKLDELICSSDLLLLCVPVECIEETLLSVAPMCGEKTIVADTASVNTLPVNTAEKVTHSFRFVSTHPMAGGEKGGYFEAKQYLFENAYAILSPSNKSDDDAIEQVQEFYQAIGAIPVVLNAEQHDYAAGVISHFPHVAAAALVNLLAAEDDSQKTMQSFAAGGFKDITRIASSSPAMWTSITKMNQVTVVKLIDRFTAILSEFRSSLTENKTQNIYSFFEKAKSLRDTVVNVETKPKYIQQLYEIYADVEDRVGAISIVADILRKENVSIKNINVQNFREEGEGVLSIAFASEEDASNAAMVLSKSGIRAGVKS